MRDTRLTGLDFLRALACLLVFAHHTTLRLNFDALTGGWRAYYLFSNMGAFGVGIFFLLSGFLLSRPFWLAYDAGAPMPSLATYAIRRAARIMPGYYVALTATLLLAALVFGTPFSPDIIQRYVAGLFFLGEFHWLTLFPAEVNGPLWSIGMEVASYVLLPIGLLALFSLRPALPGWRGRITFLAVVGVALLAHSLIVTLVPKETVDADFGHGLIGGAKSWMPQYNVAGFFVVFAMGGLTAGLSTLWRGARHEVADVLVILGLAGSALAIWSVAPTRAPESFGWLGLPYDFPYFHLGIALALFAFPHSKLLPVVSELAPIRYLAKISFGIYVWHFMVLEFIRQFFVPSFGYAGISDTTFWLELTGTAGVLSIIVGSLSWYVVESPVLNWAKRLEGPRQAPTSIAPHPNLHA
ncbi:MAG: acyltransferase [Devosia sp.]|nr:acyltransferase [Devosia sp.]